MKSTFYLLTFLICSTFLKGQCILPDWHDSSFANSWVSCTTSENPIPDLGNGHWILYDFNTPYIVDSLRVWNLNHPLLLAAGSRMLRMDISIDGIQWTNVNTFDLAIASSDKSYSGEDLDGFAPFEARYVVLSVLENHGNTSCAGLSEVKFSIGEKSTSTIDEELQSQISIAPNPADQRINININDVQSEELIIELYDMMGKRLFIEQTRSPGASYRLSIDGSTLADGHYNLRVGTEKGFATEKIVVVHPK